MNDDSSLSIDDLLRESAWISGLARSLVRDGQAADDLVQETWLSALRRPPRDARSPRGWLATVLRNTLRQQRRKEATRERHEIASGAPTEGPSTAALAERVELSRRVASLALELDEPFRSTVLRRHFEGESSAAIARREGVPEGTVRWRLKEGLDRLRGRLDREYGGDRRAWCAALLPLARQEAGVAAGGLALTAGGLLVKATYGAAAMLVVGAAVWLAPSGGGRTETDDPAREVAAAAPAVGGEDADGGPAAAAPAPERIEAAKGAAVAAEEVAAAAEERSAAITARVVDPSGRPLEGATVELTDVPGHRASSAADGTVRMTGEVPEALVPWLGNQATFRVSRAGYTTEEVRARLVLGEDVPLGDVVLRPGATVVGRVEDADGRPAADAEVWSVVLVDGKPMTAEALNSEARATTDAAGRFHLSGVPAGAVRIEARGADQERGHSAALELGAGDLVEGVGISLPPAAERPPWIDGVVVDPDGAPVSGASVNYAATLGRARVSGSTRTDEDGTFRIVANVVTAHRLFATSPAGEFRASEAVDIRPGDRVTLRLRPSRTFDVVAIGGNDGALPEFSAFTRTGESRVNTFAETADGRVALQLPDSPFTLVVEAPFHERTEVGPLDPARVLADVRVEVALRTLPPLTGVVTLDGDPVEGASVRVHRMATVRTQADGFPVRVSPPREAQGATDADGSFVLTLREAGAYVVRVEADGAAPAEIGPFEYEPTIGVAPLDVRLGEGGVLAGRVLPPPGRSAAGTIVGISRGDGYARTARVGADGRFRFERLIPGRYHVVRHDRELRPGPPQSFGTSGEAGAG
ncbi:MAG: sigma-70 family RNA polymerase sigma factor, partial [Planctomycetota bacterium JB042]